MFSLGRSVGVHGTKCLLAVLRTAAYFGQGHHCAGRTRRQNQESVVGGGVSTLHGAVSNRGNTVFVPIG